MIYEIVDKPKKMDSTLLDDAVQFACEYLNIDIDFTLEFSSTRCYEYGYCDYYDDEKIIVIAKRLSKKDIIRTLFHELAHLKQYHDGRLINGSPQTWMGVKYENTYKELPWEVEAFELEERMMQSFYG